MGYLHLGGIDRPVAVWKGLEVVHPHLSTRGHYFLATCGTSECAAGVPDITGPRLDPFGKDTGMPWTEGPPSWYGSLLDESRDASGLMYRRNRYLDPETGMFTQADPIGVAGGLNVFGYAAGDPVTYSDPFGLCKNVSDPDCARWLLAGTVIGGSAGAATALGCAGSTVGVCAAGAPAIVAAGAGIGSSIGGLIGTVDEMDIGEKIVNKISVKWDRVLTAILGLLAGEGARPMIKDEELREETEQVQEDIRKDQDRPKDGG